MFWGLSVPGPGFTTMLHSKQIGTKESLHLLGQSWDWICSGASQSLWFFSLWKSEGEVAQSCPTLCDHIGCNLPGCSIQGVFQARVLEWVCHFLLQGIFPTQGSNPGLPHCSRLFTVWATREAPSLWRILNKYFWLMKIVMFTFTSSLRHCDPIKWLVFRLPIN